tara:strand:- start:4213 stop:4638 length:426 start_codon:yes stop_codon:yes gene_type:complete
MDQKVKEQKQDQLLNDLRAGLTIKAACGQARISRQTYYNWLEESGPEGEWTLECAAARTTPQALMTNVLIQEGLKGDWRSAHTFLRNVAPDEWSDRREVELNVSNSSSSGADIVRDMIDQLRSDIESNNEASTDDEPADED